MRALRNIALISMLAIAIFSAGIVYADYQFDDLQGPSGVGSQWVVINDTNDTFGASHSEAVRISADLLTSGTARLDVISGNSANTVQDRNLQTFFLVLSEGEGQFDMSMRSQALAFDVSTPNLGLNTIVNENLTPYIDTKTADQSNNDTSEWKTFHFNVARQNDRNKYDTVIQSFMFQQNPDSSPSQAITRPMVISNVYSGTAANDKAPLVVRMALRDSSGANGNIIAYDRSTWTMNQSKTAGGNQWVLIPVDDLNTDNTRIEYYLTTEIANNTSYRYAVRYPDSTGGTVPPSAWKFDIFRPQGTTNIPRTFLLASESNIAPGLVTVYNRRYNVNEYNKTPIHVFPVDTPDYGDYDLSLNHRIIFGKRLGETYRYPAQEGRFNLFEVTAFQPRLASTTFYDDVARVTNGTGTVSVPTTQVFSSSSIKRDVIADDVLQYFTVDQSIPSDVRNSGSDGMLPLHITFNIPVTLINDNAWWNEMLKVWRDTGRIEDIFAGKYCIYLRTGDAKVLNLTQALLNNGYYSELVKVFLDEDRGRLTQDNYSGLLTISFIVMLMDGTMDGVRPGLRIVPDNSATQQNNYIIVRDGTQDNRWNMTFFIAPSDWEESSQENKPAITSTSVISAITGQPCTFQLSASGTTPITWTLSGNLPDGLTLSESGLISGTPTKAGSSTFMVTATNSIGNDSRVFTLQVLDPVSITTSSLKAGTIGKSYSVTLKGKGTKPLTWTAEGLPSGLDCNTSGKISGKPTVFGTFNVKFTLSNGAGSTTKGLTLTIKGIAPKLSGSLAKGELSVAYNSKLKLTKGSQPVTWSIAGNLPDGLSFNTSTGEISGTPTSYKSSGFKLTITASNDAGKKSKSVKLTVKGTKPKIKASLPNATIGQPYSAKLTATGSEPITWNVENLPEGLSLNGDTISGTPTGSAKSYKVRLTAKNPVKTVKKSLTLKVNLASDTRLPAMSEAVGESYSLAEYSVLPEQKLANSGGYIVVAELGTISVDVSGMYEFDVALSDDVPEGAELVYLANSDEPSDDDEIAEFYDDEGEISTVPESRKITISIWLNKEVVYSPEIAVKL